MKSAWIVACGKLMLLVEDGRVRPRSPVVSVLSVALAG